MSITQKSFANFINTGLLTGAILALTATSSYAVGFGRYRLYNHPDGTVAPPPYGLRLDGLALPNVDTVEKYTFDFEHSESKVFLTYNADTISITGQAFGGEDVGNDYQSGTTAIWDIDFTYQPVTQASGDDDVIAFEGEGTISSTEFGTFDLVAEQGTFPFAFRLGDEDDDQGHRGYDGISGWGWLNHAYDENKDPNVNVAENASHIKSSDWIFTAKSVPEPTAILGLLGVTSLGLMSQKKRK